MYKINRNPKPEWLSKTKIGDRVWVEFNVPGLPKHNYFGSFISEFKFGNHENIGIKMSTSQIYNWMVDSDGKSTGVLEGTRIIFPIVKNEMPIDAGDGE